MSSVQRPKPGQAPDSTDDPAILRGTRAPITIKV
jgi:hypothetical protein